MMTVVITMGTQRPRYITVLGENTLFYHSLQSLRSLSADMYVFAVPSEEDAGRFIEGQCEDMGIENYRVVEYGFTVSGQAECVMIASPYIRANQSLLVWDINIFTESGVIKSGRFCGDGYILCPTFADQRDSNNSDPDTVLLQQYPAQIHGVTGGFYFRTATLYERLYYDCYALADETAIGNVGVLYDRLIQSGGTVYLAKVPAANLYQRETV